MMASEKAEICIGDDIALVNFYFEGECSLNFSTMVFRNNSHCNRSFSL